MQQLGAEAQFNRLDLSNSSYYGFDKNRFVLARNTRYGQVRAFGTGSSELIPLPERLYSGGPTSLRGFSFNGAGPRDPETGYPHRWRGRAHQQHRAAPASAHAPLARRHRQLRYSSTTWATSSPTPAMPGRASSAFTSLIAVPVPFRPTMLTIPSPVPTGPLTSTGRQGPCSFNYFSHAPGHRSALPYAGRAHSLRFQLQPEHAHLPRLPRLLTSSPDICSRMSAKHRTSTSSSAWGRAFDAA